MKQHDICQGHFLVAGVAAIVASSIVAIAGLTLAQDNTTTGDTNTTTTMTSGDPGVTGGTKPQPGDTGRCPGGIALSDGRCEYPTQQGNGQQGGQWQQGGMGCGDSPERPAGYMYHWECRDGTWANEADGQGPGGQPGQQQWQGQQYPGGEQQGPTPEQISQALRQNGMGVCFFGSRWEGGGSPDSCAQQGGQWHGSYTQPRGPMDYSRPAAGPQGFPGMGPGMGGPMMGPGGMGGQMGPGMMGPGGMGGQMGPGMMGPMGPGRGPMSCDMFEDIIDEMKSRLTEIDDRWSDMEENMRERAADQIDRLKDKMEDTDDAKKIAKYEKQIAKVEAKLEKQIAKTKTRFEKQAAKMKARMEKEIAKLEDKAAECEDREESEGMGGEFNGGGFEGNFGPGGPGGGFGGPMQFGF